MPAANAGATADYYDPEGQLDDDVVSSFVNHSFSSATPTSSQPRKKRRHVPTSFRKGLLATVGNYSADQLLEELIDARYENKRLRGGLTLALDRIREERVRTDTAYAFSEELVTRIRRLHEQRSELKKKVSEARETLERWRIEYDHVRGRVVEGEEVLDRVRVELQESIQREYLARKTAWHNEVDKAEAEALLEGRRQGVLDGYKRAVNEMMTRRAATVVEEEDVEEEPPETEEEEEDEEPTYYTGGRTNTDQTFLSRPPASAGPPPIVPIPTGSNSPPRSVTPLVERWDTEVPPVDGHPAFHTPPDNFIPVLQTNGSLVMAPPHEFGGSMRATSPNPHIAVLPPASDKGKGRASNYAGSDSTTISNLPITQDLTHESTPVGIHVESARPPSQYAGSSRLPPASQFQLSRTDEWDQQPPATYPASLAQHVQPYSQNPDPSRPWFEPLSPAPTVSEVETRNPDITPFDPGLTPSIRRFEGLPQARSRVNSAASRVNNAAGRLGVDGRSVKSGKSGRSRLSLSVANPDPPSPAQQFVFPRQGRPTSQYTNASQARPYRAPSPNGSQSQYRAPSANGRSASQSQYGDRPPSQYGGRPPSQYAGSAAAGRAGSAGTGQHRPPSPNMSTYSRHSRAASNTTHPGVAGIGAGRGPSPTAKLDNMLDSSAEHRPLHRARSSLSQRTQGRYDHYEADPRDDPAIWGAGM